MWPATKDGPTRLLEANSLRVGRGRGRRGSRGRIERANLGDHRAADTGRDHAAAVQVASDLAVRHAIDAGAAARVEADIAQAAAPSQGEGAGSPEKPAAETFVAVTEADVKVCGSLYAYSLAAHQWAQGLIREGVGE